jgi:hypothetical protein
MSIVFTRLAVDKRQPEHRLPSMTKVCPRSILAAAGAILVLLFTSGGADARDKVGEYIVVAGGPALRSWENLRKDVDQHDRSWYNFVRKAKFRIKELMDQHGRGIQATLLVYRPAYAARQSEEGRPLVQWIESIRDDYFKGRHHFDMDIVWFDTAAELVQYLNRGQNRRTTKIVNFEYFGHSNRHAFMFDYSNAVMGASKEWLHETDLERIGRSAFAKNAYCRSFGCHTGESMSQKWHEATGVRMWGVVGKTDYSISNTEALISPGGYWKY